MVDPVLQARRALAVSAASAAVAGAAASGRQHAARGSELAGRCTACTTNPGRCTWSWTLMLGHWPTIHSGEHWQQSDAGAGLQLARDAGGRLRVSGAGQ